MLIACWSVKGGSGTTVVAASLGLVLARRPGGATIVDLAGDVAAALGVSPVGPNPVAWSADADLRAAATEVAPGLRLLALPPGADAAAGERLAARLEGPHPVVVDCGSVVTPAGVSVAAVASVSLLVIRPCYLALRRALDAPVRPSGVVVVDEPGRSLTGHDVSEVLGVPVRAVVPCTKDIARRVDAGLLATRLPRPLAGALRRAA